jgi:hypothetical protein
MTIRLHSFSVKFQGKVAALVMFWMLFGILTSFGQKVDIRMSPPSPFALKVNDLFNVELNNKGRVQQSVYLQGTVEKIGKGQVLRAQTETFRLERGTKILSGYRLNTTKMTFRNGKVEKAVRATGNLPSGNYIICVKLKRLRQDQLISQYCLEQSVSNQTPPQLAYPTNGSKLNNPLPGFTWIPPAPQPTGNNYSYKVEVTEVHNNQKPRDAMLNNPIFFRKKVGKQTNLQYPPYAPDLERGKNYAWQVTAFSRDYRIGKTQVWTFEIKEDETLEIKKNQPKGDFLKLKPAIDGNSHMIDQFLRFTFQESYNTKILDFDFYNDKDEKVTPSDLNLVDKYGSNYYEVDLSKYSAFEEGKYYTLKIQDLNKKDFYLKFKYKGKVK